MQTVDQIIKYESGEMSDVETLRFFADLIKSRMAWSLQGSYGRTAQALISDGFITIKGEITDKARDFIELQEA
jgi:hypothetical protein